MYFVLMAFSLVMSCFKSWSFQTVFQPTAAAVFEASKTSSKLLSHPKLPVLVAGTFANSGHRAGRRNWWSRESSCRNKGNRGILRISILCSSTVGAAGELGVLGQTTMVVADTTPVCAGEDEKQNCDAPLPDLLTEFIVDMKCEACVKAVCNKVEPLQGVKAVEVDLANQVVRIHGCASTKSLTTAIEESGRSVRLIGQGVLSEFTVSAAVAEFKGPQIHGVVRFAQVAMELSRIEANFSGLTPGKHGWSINMYGDLTKGAASTGGIYKLESSQSACTTMEVMGDMGILEVGSDGAAEFNGTKLGLQVHDLIGRAVVIYENEDKSRDGITAAVIARSAGVGQNYKKLCSCDGTIIWESTNSDFVKP